jgi:Tfp pilus assembly protein PilN
MSTLTTGRGTELVTLPRVNLLPPEIEEQRRFKRVQAGLGAGVVVALGAVALLFLAANGQVADAQDQVDAEQARKTTLQTEAAKYDEVPDVYAAVEAGEAELSLAMAKEIRWSYFLNDLSLSTPNKVWLTQMTAIEKVDGAAAAAAPVTGAATAFGTAGIGTVTFTGKGSTHNDVAAWLKSLNGRPGLADPYFTKSAKELIGTEDAVSFDSQVVVTEDLLSGRYTDKAGS